jgi:hypothetical protein
MRRQLGAVFAAATIFTSLGAVALSAPAYAAGCVPKTKTDYLPDFDDYGGYAWCTGGSSGHIRASVKCMAEATEKTYTVNGDRVWSDSSHPDTLQLSAAWCRPGDAREKLTYILG